MRRVASGLGQCTPSEASMLTPASRGLGASSALVCVSESAAAASEEGAASVTSGAAPAAVPACSCCCSCSLCFLSASSCCCSPAIAACHGTQDQFVHVLISPYTQELWDNLETRSDGAQCDQVGSLVADCAEESKENK